jgi:hypothetical protein
LVVEIGVCYVAEGCFLDFWKGLQEFFFILDVFVTLLKLSDFLRRSTLLVRHHLLRSFGLKFSLLQLLPLPLLFTKQALLPHLPLQEFKLTIINGNIGYLLN